MNTSKTHSNHASTTTNTDNTSTSNSPACAVCKFRRRKCSKDCKLAPYFPANKERDFLNVHKLFGVNNLMRVLESVKATKEKEIAMKTMIIEARLREEDPVEGCCRMINAIRRQIVYYEIELNLVLRQLELCRNHHTLVQNEKRMV
ncbi:hypothetical protein LIER_30661 [Lithospermum erythrorhizon]|uniref:LOB domain-containing protein n=1 Tax=Lithospermum erythrorhizon TaxID=34254 RepID=A0AAV3RNF5_LITER